MEDFTTPFEALELAVSRAGSQPKLAEICGVSQTAVWKWLRSTKRLPAEHVLAVEAATGVSRNHLRPDLYPRGLTDGRPFSPAGRTVGDGAPTGSSNRSAALEQIEAGR